MGSFDSAVPAASGSPRSAHDDNRWGDTLFLKRASRGEALAGKRESHHSPTRLVPSLILDKQIGKLLLERFDLWTIANQNVGIRRVMQRVILMVVLGAVKTL